MPPEAWWARSPIIIVPLAAFALGLALVPFAVWNADHAAEFFGAFAAAIVAAGAVIGTTTLSARLARQQRRDERKAEMLAEALELYAWMGTLAYDFSYVAIVLRSWFDTVPIDTVTVANMRSNLSMDVRTRLRNRLIVASRLPMPFSHNIVDTLHRGDAMLDTICYLPMLDGQVLFPHAAISQRQGFAAHFTRVIRWHRAKLGQYLLDQGQITSLSNEDIEALQVGAPPYQPAGFAVPPPTP